MIIKEIKQLKSHWLWKIIVNLHTLQNVLYFIKALKTSQIIEWKKKGINYANINILDKEIKSMC